MNPNILATATGGLADVTALTTDATTLWLSVAGVVVLIVGFTIGKRLVKKVG